MTIFIVSTKKIEKTNVDKNSKIIFHKNKDLLL